MITDNNPWAGLSSYEDPKKAEREGRKPKKFCGRDDESHAMTQLVAGNIFVTLYGKSGTGKTSLLNAGVFPQLRDKRYLPVSIRLSMDALGTTFQKCIVSLLAKAVSDSQGRQDTIDVVPLPDEQQPDYLWSYFARTRFVNAEGQTLFPVIVLDQFEEIFRDRRPEAEALLRQIAFLMDESHALSPRMVDGVPYKYNFNFRFVASIREDDLYRLEDSIDNNYLPELKRCRYRLCSLTQEGARDAILIPGEGLFRPEDESSIVEKIVDKSRNEDGSISTNIISLLCSRIYVDFQKQKATSITPDMVTTFIKGNPFERFYKEATHGFSNRERSYTEDHLVDSTGRRNSLPESDFLLHVKNGALLLEGARKILQRTSTSSDGGSHRIELIHDSFCEPLATLAKKRERRRRLTWIGVIAAITAAYVVMGLYIFRLGGQVSERKAELADLEEELEESNTKLALYEKSMTEGYTNNFDVQYTYDGIVYKHGFPTEEQMDEWKDENEDICRKKIEEAVQDYDVPSSMLRDDPCTVYLVLNSRTLEEDDARQRWFDLWEIMSIEQKQKLCNILYRELYTQTVVRFKDMIAEKNSQAYVYARNGDFSKAHETIDKAISDAITTHAAVLDSKGEFYLMQGNTQEAVKMWHKVMEVCPDFLDRQRQHETELHRQLVERRLIN